MADPAQRVTGIVLAGGRSTRFGRDKLAEPYRGRRLLEHAIAAVAEVADEVVVVVAASAPTPSLGEEGPEVRIARDEIEGQGPLAGAVAGLRAARGELAVLAGGDMPGLVPGVLGAMVERASDPVVDAVALAEGDRFRPLPSVVRVAAALEVGDHVLAAGGRRLRDALAELEPVVLGEAAWTALDPERSTLHDVDAPSDLVRLSRER